MTISTVLIIEDEKPNADRLKRLLALIRPLAKVMGVVSSIGEAVKWLGEFSKPDLILMDVRLSDGLSFDIFKQVKVSSPVIFTTAYDEYAIQAFKHNSIDYLLKPVEQAELAVAIEKCESVHSSDVDLGATIKDLIQSLQPKDYRSRFLLPYRDGFKTLLTENIMFVYSEFRITHARLDDGGTEIIPQSLEELEQQLDPKKFFRANRQYIVHIDAIQQVHNYFNGKLKVELKKSPNTEVIISREKAVPFKLWLDY